jgi:hypothetical protein
MRVMSKRCLEDILPRELWQDIFFRTNKRICNGFDYREVTKSITNEKIRNKSVWDWHLERDIWKKLDKMEAVIELIRKSESVKARKRLKADSVDIMKCCETADLKRRGQEVYVKVNSLTTGCDICKDYKKVMTCSQCLMDSCNACTNFIECNICGYLVCFDCMHMCMNCVGFICDYCVVTCEVTNKTECQNCISKCCYCQKAMSHKKHEKCGECLFGEHVYCEECLLECICDFIGCEDHMEECELCGESRCKDCIMKTGEYLRLCIVCLKNCVMCGKETHEETMCKVCSEL